MLPSGDLLSLSKAKSPFGATPIWRTDTSGRRYNRENR
ncbi:hypothetical protein J2W51_003383 [Tardiphaga robiniae]|nr:hypothetical protein [Tardiphaga robiniae]